MAVSNETAFFVGRNLQTIFAGAGVGAGGVTLAAGAS